MTLHVVILVAGVRSGIADIWSSSIVSRSDITAVVGSAAATKIRRGDRLPVSNEHRNEQKDESASAASAA